MKSAALIVLGVAKAKDPLKQFPTTDLPRIHRAAQAGRVLPDRARMRGSTQPEWTQTPNCPLRPNRKPFFPELFPGRCAACRELLDLPGERRKRLRRQLQ